MRWVPVATAPHQMLAEIWRDLLEDEGVNAIVRVADTSSFLGVSNMPVRLMVPEDQIEQARQVLSGHGIPSA